jgi:RHS repeat-associated protein
MPVINYLWNPLNDNIVREFDDAGTIIAEYTTEADQFGNVVSQRRSGQDCVYHYEGLGSTLTLTDANGDVTDTYAYSAFGEVTAHAGNTVNPFQYIGRKQYYRDQETGEYEVRRRTLDADSGGWLTPNPIPTERFQSRALAGLPLNSYAYVRGNPCNTVDWSGVRTVVLILAELPWDPDWERKQWEEYIKAGGFPPGHFDDDRPPAYPKGPFPPTTPADPIAWGVELGDETHYPDAKEADDKSGKCVCNDPTRVESRMRPRGSKGDYPRPGRGEITCEVGKKVTMRYEGRCVPKDGPPFPKHCGDCTSQTCSRYIAWVCKEARITPQNPFGTSWFVLNGLRRTKCKDKA